MPPRQVPPPLRDNKRHHRRDSYFGRADLVFDDDSRGTLPRRYRASRDEESSISSWDDEKKPSAYDEAEFYRWNHVPEPEPEFSCCCCPPHWSRRRRLIVWGSALASVILLIIIIAAGVTVAKRNSFRYVPSDAHVTNAAAFTSGGATRRSVNDTEDGIGAGRDKYTYYSGEADLFPPHNEWVSFEDMWQANLETLQSSCGWLDVGPDNTDSMIASIHTHIQSRAAASLVDHRLILAIILQESNGCVRVGSTRSSGGVRNPGLMQSHNGHAFRAAHEDLSIAQMIQDGTQGTAHGDGLVQNLNLYGSVWRACRGYNSGHIPDSEDLSEEAGATACYVSDVANRLTGWVRSESRCPNE